MAKTANYFGNFPCRPDEKKPTLMNRESIKIFIYTPENPYFSDLNWLLASTDMLTVGIFQVSPGATFDPPDVHAGDEVYYIIKGTLHELNPESGSVEEVQQGESLLIPQGVAHKAYNFGTDELVILYAIAPKIWDQDGPPAGFNGKMKLYKY
jgi:mannose-6-phosphate isomerase-like protein (cupin superfamily)